MLAAGKRLPLPLLLSALLLLLAGVACPACRTEPVRVPVPVAPAARAALERAQELLALGRPELRPEASAELERAVEQAPDWVPPRRARDELARAELRGVAVLAEHLQSLSVHPRDPITLYLCGRLEGRAGVLRFEEAVRADPTFAWGWHGLAWAAQQSGHRNEARAHARRALALARDPWERAFFAQSLARLLALLREHEAAAGVIADEIAHPDVSPRDRNTLAVQAVVIGLEVPDLALRRRAVDRGLVLLQNEALSEAEVFELTGRLQGAAAYEDPENHRLILALSTRSSPARDRLRAELLLDAAPTPLALGLFERAAAEEGRDGPSGPSLRAARFWARHYGAGIDHWLAGLPSVVLDSERLPRDARLARVVASVRRLDAPAADLLARGARLAELGDALVDAGWFREARAIAAELAEHDLAAALDLDARALAGLEAVLGIVQAVRRADLHQLFQTRRGAAPGAAWRRLFEDAATDRSVEVLDDLLAEFAAPIARAHAFLGGETDIVRVRTSLLTSPRLSYAPVGEMVHPGAHFSAADEAAGLGPRGLEVGGLAAEMGRLGRFALFGELAGAGGPDGTLLPTLLVEPRLGEHLGVAWTGTVAWCESAELKTRAGRAGAHISAAALHEGYWLDVDAVRGEYEVWQALVRDFSGPGARERVTEVLAVKGLRVDRPSASEETPPRMRIRGSALLGEAQRVRLALLAERAADGAALGTIALDELVLVTATHEEGHLCDRARFLPILEHLGAGLAFALECGFSPQRVQEMLEYRAQLTALCDVPDPRMPLAQVLDAAETGANGVTPHAAGYVRLLEDLLELLDRTHARTPARFPVLDRERTLAHQLHLLGPEDVRGLARDLARQKRLSK